MEPRAVILLHGVLEEASDLEEVASRLRAAGRVVHAPDAPGHGARAWSSGLDWSPRAQAEDALPLLARVGPAHVVGHSRGATAASWLAVEHPDLVTSLAIVASPPQPGEAFRAHFRRVRPRDARESEAFAYLASIPEEDFPAHALRRYPGRALVVEAGDDPLYSPTHTLFWRMFLPYASFERVEGGHSFFKEPEGARLLVDLLLANFEEAERA